MVCNEIKQGIILNTNLNKFKRSLQILFNELLNVDLHLLDNTIKRFMDKEITYSEIWNILTDSIDKNNISENLKMLEIYYNIVFCDYLDDIINYDE